MKKNHFLKRRLLSLICMFSLVCGLIITGPVVKKAEAASCKTGYVNYAYLNLRASASTKAKIVVKLDRKDKVTILQTKGSWYKVTATHKGKAYVGYVASRYIKLYKTCVKLGYVSKATLKLYKLPNSASKVILKLSKNDIVTIRSTTGSYYKVIAIHKNKAYQGYLKKKYISDKKVSEKTEETAAQESTKAPESAEQETTKAPESTETTETSAVESSAEETSSSYVIPEGAITGKTNSWVRLRRTATDKADNIIVTLDEGDVVILDHHAGGWEFVKAIHKGKVYEGYVYKPYITWDRY